MIVHTISVVPVSGELAVLIPRLIPMKTIVTNLETLLSALIYGTTVPPIMAIKKNKKQKCGYHLESLRLSSVLVSPPHRATPFFFVFFQFE